MYTCMWSVARSLGAASVELTRIGLIYLWDCASLILLRQFQESTNLIQARGAL